jgi:hypothetical protein
MNKNRTTGPDRSLRLIPRVAAAGKSGRIKAANVRLDDYAQKILLSVLAEIEALPVLGSGLQHGAAYELLQIRDMGIPYRPGVWYGVSLDCDQRQAYSRAAMRLEGVGFLRRITEPRRDRVTHLQPTADGLRMTLRLAGWRADRSAIAAGLSMTRWGSELAAVIGGESRH